MVNDKTIENHFCVCAISLEINYWNAHCFTPVVFSVQTGVVLHKRIVVSADSKVYGRRKKVGINILCRESRDQKRKSNWPFFLEYLGEKGRGVSKFYIFPAHWNCTKTGVVKNRGLTERSSYWQPSRHWLHPGLSFGQPQVQPVTKRLPIWRPFCFQYLPN